MGKNNVLGKIVSFCACICLCIIIPNINIQAETTENFSIKVETDKQEYSKNDVLSYEIIVKNISQNRSNDLVIQDEFPEAVVILESDGKIDEQIVTWKIDELEEDEEIKLYLKVKMKDDIKEEIIVKPSTPNDSDNSKEDINLPKTGEINSFFIIGIGLVLVLIGTWIYKVKGKKSTIALVLALAMSISLFSNIKIVQAATITINESVSHNIKVGDENITSNITISANIIESEKEVELKATRILTAVTLEWDTNNETTYTVKKGTSRNELNTIQEDVTIGTYVDLETDMKKEYYYQIIAYKDGKEIFKSKIVKVKTFIDSDEDLLTDEEELKIGTDPNNNDTDGDGLTDGEEVIKYNTNPLIVDTDNDALNDYEEVYLTFTNPNKSDSDDNGILDADEDIDSDNLTNKQEIEYNTDPILEDTDYDGINDYDEVKIYKTNPVMEDTDEDGLSDLIEIKLGTDPNNKDSNGNGINDGDESYNTIVEVSENEQDDVVKVSISGDLKGANIENIIIRNMEGIHSFITKDIPGYVGSPFAIGIKGENNEQEVSIKFTVDEEIIKEHGRIALYEYDKTDMSLKEVNQNARILSSNEIIINTKLINEYKEYVILLADYWNEAWNKEILEPNTEFSDMDIVLTIDSSGSMSDNDRSDLRKVGSINLINKLQGNNRAAIVDFDSSAVIRQGLTTDKEALISAINRIDSYGGTNISRGLAKAINALEVSSKGILTDEVIDTFYIDEVEVLSNDEEGTSLENITDDEQIDIVAYNSENIKRDKYIMLLTDGQSTVSENDPSLVYARENGIKIFTIGLGSGVQESTLRMIASTTGGKYLFATSADDLIALFDELVTQTIDLYTDTDKDGIPDYFERNLRLITGEIISLDPNNPDTDEDGLSDGEEICGVTGDRNAFFDKYIKEKKAFDYVSKPNKSDTDYDGIDDKNDSTPNKVNDVCDRDLAITAQISYTDLNEKKYLQKTIDEIRTNYPNKEFKGLNETYNNLLDEMKNWTVIKANNSNALIDIFDHLGFGAVALENNGRIIISYRGTEPVDFNGDWITDILTFTIGTSPQSHAAQKLYKAIEKEYPNHELYVSGHSLGGMLTQDVVYEIIQENNKSKKSKINEPTRVATFNAPGFAFISFWDREIKEKMKLITNNHWVKYDLTGDGLGTFFGVRLGKNLDPIITNEKPLLGIGYIFAKVHGMDRFWDVVKR